MDPEGEGNPHRTSFLIVPWRGSLRFPPGTVHHVLEGKGIIVPEGEGSLRIMDRKHLIILGLLVFFISCIIIMTLWMAGHLG